LVLSALSCHLSAVLETNQLVGKELTLDESPFGGLFTSISKSLIRGVVEPVDLDTP
jgi:hypothetical protein